MKVGPHLHVATFRADLNMPGPDEIVVKFHGREPSRTVEREVMEQKRRALGERPDSARMRQHEAEDSHRVGAYRQAGIHKNRSLIPDIIAAEQTGQGIDLYRNYAVKARNKSRGCNLSPGHAQWSTFPLLIFPLRRPPMQDLSAARRGRNQSRSHPAGARHQVSCCPSRPSAE